MESLPEIKNLLDVVKKELPELTTSLDSKTLDNIDKYFSKLENNLKMQKVKLQTDIQNEINKGIEMEYKIPKHSLIDDSVPYIQMKPELYTLKTIDKFDFKKQDIDSFSISKDIIKFQTHFTSHKNLRLFGVPVIVPENEYVVYIKFHCPCLRTCYQREQNTTITVSFLCRITYITNYGRFINKDFPLYTYNEIKDRNDTFRINGDSIIHSLIHFANLNNNGFDTTYNFSDINVKPNPLTYRMPVIFIKILDAIHNENTELLQECFQEYHSRYIENKTLKEENKMILETIKQPYEEMKPKYEMLEKENKIIKEENARLKLELELELELLKIKMQETKKMYMA
jgi:hypothetical protein